jgi:hypothetical protein
MIEMFRRKFLSIILAMAVMNVHAFRVFGSRGNALGPNARDNK